MSKPKTDEEIAETAHAFADTTNRFPKDRMLRDAGFAIDGRAKGKEPVWRRRGKSFTQSEALIIATKEAKQ